MKLQGEYVLSEIGDEIIACSVGDDKPRVVTLNETGVVLWHLLEEGSTEAGLADVLCQQFEVSEEKAHADVAAFIENLQFHGVL